MRLRSTVNWVLLGLNALLFMLLVLVLLHAIIPGKDIDFVKGPFEFSSWKDLWGETCFTLLWTDEPIDISLLRDYPVGIPVEQEGPLDKRVVVGLGEGLSLSICYSGSPTADLEIREITVSRDKGASLESWTDYKGDGSYDVRLTRDFGKKAGRDYVFLEGQPEQVVHTFGTFEKEISGGRRVRYDWTSGVWQVEQKR